VQDDEPGSSHAASEGRGVSTPGLVNEHISTTTMTGGVHTQQCSMNLDAMDAVFHKIVMRRLHSPMGYESLGKNMPPLAVQHSTFSDYVRSMKIVG